MVLWHFTWRNGKYRRLSLIWNKKLSLYDHYSIAFNSVSFLLDWNIFRELLQYKSYKFWNRWLLDPLVSENKMFFKCVIHRFKRTNPRINRLMYIQFTSCVCWGYNYTKQYVIEIHYFLLEMTLSNSWVHLCCMLVAIRGGLQLYWNICLTNLYRFFGFSC